MNAIVEGLLFSRDLLVRVNFGDVGTQHFDFLLGLELEELLQNHPSRECEGVGEAEVDEVGCLGLGGGLDAGEDENHERIQEIFYTEGSRL